MKPKNLIFCPDSDKPKLLFESEKKALNFIKFNGDSFDTEYAPKRVYYCIACGGYHLTSQEVPKKGATTRTSKMIEATKEETLRIIDYYWSVPLKVVLSKEALGKDLILKNFYPDSIIKLKNVLGKIRKDQPTSEEDLMALKENHKAEIVCL